MISFDQRRFRDVLGHLPSGVAAITGIDSEHNPVGMIVGTFASLSLEPPLVAFFVDQNSTSFPRMRASGSFCANILSARQEALCRAMSARGGEKFSGVDWRPAESGAPILDGAVAWVDCDIDSVTEAGDHLIVIGRVRDLDISTPTIPLLFFQGGFGGFSTTSLAADARGSVLDSSLLDTLRCVDGIRAGMEALAHELGVDCLAHAVHGQHTIVIAAAYARRRSTRIQVGHQLPLVPPWAELFWAWAPPAELATWLDRLRNDSRGRYDVASVVESVQRIKAAGWAFTLRNVANDDRALTDLFEYGYTPAVERDLADLILRVPMEHGEPESLDALPTGAVRNLFAPVWGRDGDLALIIALHNLPAELPAEEPRVCLEHLLEITKSTMAPTSAHAELD